MRRDGGSRVMGERVKEVGVGNGKARGRIAVEDAVY